jgi:hypothetical protein
LLDFDVIRVKSPTKNLETQTAQTSSTVNDTTISGEETIAPAASHHNVSLPKNPQGHDVIAAHSFDLDINLDHLEIKSLPTNYRRL